MTISLMQQGSQIEPIEIQEGQPLLAQEEEAEQKTEEAEEEAK